MKFCPACDQKYADDTLNFCLEDGVGLSTVSFSDRETIAMGQPRATAPTAYHQPSGVLSTAGQFGSPTPKSTSRAWVWVLLILGVMVVMCGGGSVLIYTLMPEKSAYVVGNGVTGPNSSPGNAVSSSKTPDKERAPLKMENFERLKTGMTYQQVVELLGVEGELISESGSGAYKTGVYWWRGNDSGVISIIFMNDKLFSKTKTGL
ncbi:MAG: DUF3862 domain-containing protein [Pyrinomonadaceae bacterium]